MDNWICEFVKLLDVENGSFHLGDFGLEVFLEFSDLLEENVGFECGLFERCLVGLLCPFLIFLSSFVIILYPFKPIVEH
jgi:hypothetical protein